MSSPISSITGANPAEAAAAAGQTLSQADFLKLLVTQMSSQNPLNPQSDTEFAAQLAQFSALQQTQSMSENMSVLQANAMMGEMVTVAPSDGAAPVSGQVSAVLIQSGTPVIMVNGRSYDLSEVTAMAPPVSNTTATTTQTSN